MCRLHVPPLNLMHITHWRYFWIILFQFSATKKKFRRVRWCFVLFFRYSIVISQTSLHLKQKYIGIFDFKFEGNTSRRAETEIYRPWGRYSPSSDFCLTLSKNMCIRTDTLLSIKYTYCFIINKSYLNKF